MTDPTESGIAVIESKWNEEGVSMRKNASVRPMFDMLCDLHFGNTHEYAYEMVATSGALAETIERMAWNKDISTIYIAAHGSKAGLHLHGGDVVSRTKLSNMLLAGGTRRTLSGVYLGACEFGTEKVARFLLSRDDKLRWVAGYQFSADFVDGSALDAIFFNTWLRHLQDNPESKSRERIEWVARILRKSCRGLINTPQENGDDPDDENPVGMGLSIYVRSKGPSSNIIDLLREDE